MVSLNSLPPVALACIAKHLDSAIDTNALVQTCTRLYHILDPFLYQYDCQQDSPAALVWAASQRDSAAVAAATARKALVACRDPALCGRRRRNHDDDDDTTQIKKALFAAVVYNNVGIAQLLLGGTEEEVDGGVDPNARSNDPPRDTLLIRAGGLGHAEIVDFLLSLPVDVNARDASGRSALLRAVEGATAAHRGPHVAVVRKLLAYPGEDLNAQDADGFTALASLARLGHAELAEEMLQTGKVSYSGGVNSSNSTTNHCVIATSLKIPNAWGATHDCAIVTQRSTTGQSGRLTVHRKVEGRTVQSLLQTKLPGHPDSTILQALACDPEHFKLVYEASSYFTTLCPPFE